MDVERTIEFIVARQAQFSSDIGVLKERMDALTSNIDKLTVDVGVIERATRALIQIAQENRDQINEDRAEIKALRQDFQSMLKVVEGLVRGRNGGSSKPN
jgi:uncharacterized protein YoxC